MKYKALIFDLDGTAMPGEFSALPSDELVKVVSRARKELLISIATGRSISSGKHIIDRLKIDLPCVISGGTQIIDPKTWKTLWEKRLEKFQVIEIIEACKRFDYEILFSDELEGEPASTKKILGPERIIYIMNVNFKDGRKIISKINTIKNVIAHEVSSWTKGNMDIHVTHSEATKKYAIENLLRVLGVGKSETIGVGDSTNDLPLFEMVGYKIAMSNAKDELKKLANYIAPPVTEDGLATTIEMILSNNLPLE